MGYCFKNAYAKINLTLDVLGRREDGYHELEMIMQRVSLCDTVCVRSGCGGEEIRVRTNLGYLPGDERNIAAKAARAFFHAARIRCDGVGIAIEKRIPVAAGLAGGSADAAAVLRALDELYGTGFSVETLCEIGLQVGADVPFCIRGGTMLAQGVGERLTELASAPECFAVLAKPRFGASTAKVFGALDLDAIGQRPDTQAVIAALGRGDLAAVAQGMCNVLEPLVAEKYRDVLRIKNTLLECGALGAVMSGSGTTTFGLFDREQAARCAWEKLRRRYRDTFLTRTL